MQTRSTSKHDLYIGGRYLPAASGEYFESDNPYSGEIWAQVARAGAADVDAAAAAARAAFPSWAAVSPSARGRLLTRLADIVEREAPRLAETEVRDNGKLIAEMSAQTAACAGWYRYYGGLADKIEGSVIPLDRPGVLNYTTHEPLGVVGLITAWNSPLLLLAWKLAAALAAGNTCVIKPSEHASVSTLEFASLFDEAGFPPGVVNVVTGFGDECGAAIVDHPDIVKIAFTGSDAVGRRIYEAAARRLKRVTLELGGKSPNIVFDDADFEAAVMGVISGIFAATGQTCIAGSRALVQRSVHDRFVERLTEVAGSAVIGDPMSLDTHVGPVTTEPQFRKVLDYIDVAHSEGAECVLGGGRYSGPGAEGPRFVQPTVFTGVSNEMRIAREEVFGPVLSVIGFDTEDEAVEIANDIDFGLAAGVWTQNLGRAMRVSDALEAGTVWVNTYRAVGFNSPFGGWKQSGIGRESGIEGMMEYLQTKSVWMAQESSVANPFILR